ncbi:hypothetical protein [Methylobacterium haplocladii]|uniref:hypothetical protein n=1 Tax=Methylobacterium haplocladii TaxID=1176176 RepID=UPI0024E0F5CC|nr:hypothetical protein [Methylobacterium haplocladii]
MPTHISRGLPPTPVQKALLHRLAREGSIAKVGPWGLPTIWSLRLRGLVRREPAEGGARREGTTPAATGVLTAAGTRRLANALQDASAGRPAWLRGGP